MKASRIFILAIASTGIASASVVTQTKTFSYVPADTATLTFDKFDPSLGTLNSITVTTAVTKSGGSLYVDNDSATPASGNISQSVTIFLNSIDVDLLASTGGFIGQNVNAISTYAASVGPDDGDGAGVQPGGIDYDGTSFAPTSTSVTQTVRALVMSEYVGAGLTYDIDAIGSQGFDAAGFGGAAIQITPATATGGVTIIYDFTPIPEPGSALLGGLGALALLRRRR